MDKNNTSEITYKGAHIIDKSIKMHFVTSLSLDLRVNLLSGHTIHDMMLALCDPETPLAPFGPWLLVEF